jgi:hypothetical protein
MNVEEYPEIETDFPGGMEQGSPSSEEDCL